MVAATQAGRGQHVRLGQARVTADRDARNPLARHPATSGDAGWRYPGSERDLLAELTGVLAGATRDGAELEARPWPVDDDPCELVVIEVLRQHELEPIADPLGHREPQRGVDVARNEREVVAGPHDHRVESEKLPGKAQHVAGHGANRHLVRVSSLGHALQLAGDEQRPQVALTERRIRHERRLDLARRSGQLQKHRVVADAGIAGDVEPRHQTQFRSELHAAVAQPVLAAAHLDAPVVGHRDLSVQRRSAHGAGQLQLRHHLHARDAVGHGERANRTEAHVERRGGERFGQFHRRAARLIDQCRGDARELGHRFAIGPCRDGGAARQPGTAPGAGPREVGVELAAKAARHVQKRAAHRDGQGVAVRCAAPDGKAPVDRGLAAVELSVQSLHRDAGGVEHDRARPVGHGQPPWLHDHAAVFDPDRALQLALARRARHFDVERRSSTDACRHHEVEQRHGRTAVQMQASVHAVGDTHAARRHDRGLRSAPLERVHVQEPCLEPECRGPLRGQLDGANRHLAGVLLEGGAHRVQAWRRRGAFDRHVQRPRQIRHLPAQCREHGSHGHRGLQPEGRGVASSPSHRAVCREAMTSGRSRGLRTGCRAPCRPADSRGSPACRLRQPPSRRAPVPADRA